MLFIFKRSNNVSSTCLWNQDQQKLLLSWLFGNSREQQHREQQPKLLPSRWCGGTRIGEYSLHSRHHQSHQQPSLDKTIKNNNSRSSLSSWLKDRQTFNSIEDIPNYDELKNEIQNETTNNDEEQQHIGLTVSSVKNKKSNPKKKQVSETILTIAYDIAIKPIPITYIQVVLLPKLNWHYASNLI